MLTEAVNMKNFGRNHQQLLIFFQIENKIIFHMKTLF